MAVKWTEPAFTRDRYDFAGEALTQAIAKEVTLDKVQFEYARKMINNWRSSHAYPLYKIRNKVRYAALQMEPSVLVAQRIKRMESILRKLGAKRDLKLTQIQDLGGCRAVFSRLEFLDYATVVLKERCSPFTLHRIDDYIRHPKRSGYRSLHFVYEFKEDGATAYEGMRIEIQFRTQIQHVWATAVEIASTFLDQPLKFGQGDAKWLRFFALTSSLFAHEEGMKLVPHTPKNLDELKAEIKALDDEVKIRDSLNGFKAAVKWHEEGAVAKKKAYYYLLKLNFEKRVLNIRAYSFKQENEAIKDYQTNEQKSGSRADVVLVAADNVKGLRSAYPNYFSDTRMFVDLLDRLTA